MQVVNFDNAATTYPKPASVSKAVYIAAQKYGGNPGRGGHAISMAVSDKIYRVRQAAADMFGAEVEKTVFTLNCTHALNMAIKGIMSGGGHIIISSLEHNAVARPVYALTQNKGVSFSVAEAAGSDDEIIYNFERLINSRTKAVCATVASNVTGRILPYRKIAQLCRKYNICYIADAAQAAGVLPLNMSDGFDFLCMAGHKGLYGPTGTGLLISSGRFELPTVIEGGTGTNSIELVQGTDFPEAYESGTINTVGIIGLGEGIKFVRQKGINTIYSHEAGLCERFINKISRIPDIKIYRQKNAEYVPIVSFNIGDMDSQAVAGKLSEMGFALRGGMQCAGVAHRFLGTDKQGTVRFAPSAFSTEVNVERLSLAVARIAMAK